MLRPASARSPWISVTASALCRTYSCASCSTFWLRATIVYKETDGSCDGRHGLEFDGKAEFGEAFDEAARLHLGPPTIEVSGSEIFIERAVFEHVIDGREDGGGDSADRFLRSASTAQSHELRMQVGGLGARGRPSALNEHGLQPGSSPAQASRPALAGTFVVARTQASNTPLSNFASTFVGSGSNGRGIARLNEP